MKIKELVEKLNPVKVNYCGKENIEVKNIAQDSRNPKGTVFFAYKGENIPLSPAHGRYSAQPDNLNAIAASIATP